jgi:hypothetical protein
MTPRAAPPADGFPPPARAVILRVMEAATLPAEPDTSDTYQQVTEALRAWNLLAVRTARLVALSRAVLAETAPIVGLPSPAAQDPTCDR